MTFPSEFGAATRAVLWDALVAEGDPELVIEPRLVEYGTIDLRTRWVVRDGAVHEWSGQGNHAGWTGTRFEHADDAARAVLHSVAVSRRSRNGFPADGWAGSLVRVLPVDFEDLGDEQETRLRWFVNGSPRTAACKRDRLVNPALQFTSVARMALADIIPAALGRLPAGADTGEDTDRNRDGLVLHDGGLVTARADNGDDLERARLVLGGNVSNDPAVRAAWDAVVPGAVPAPADIMQDDAAWTVELDGRRATLFGQHTARAAWQMAIAMRIPLSELRSALAVRDLRVAVDPVAQTYADDHGAAPHAAALGVELGNPVEAPAMLQGIRRASTTMFEHGELETSIRIERRGPARWAVVRRDRAHEVHLGEFGDLEDAERFVLVEARSSRPGFPARLDAQGRRAWPLGPTAISHGGASRLEWRGEHGAQRWAESAEIGLLNELAWVREVSVPDLVGRRFSPEVDRVGLTIDAESFGRAVARGRSGFPDDETSSVVCAEFVRLFEAGMIPRAAWGTIESALYGTWMDNASSGLPVDFAFMALWDLVKDHRPRALVDADVVSVHPVLAALAVEYAFSMTSRGPALTRRWPTSPRRHVDRWNGASWVPDDAGGDVQLRPVSRSEAMRFVGGWETAGFA